ncbi:MAG: S41 family peptidase [Patescibacteria group bacterium]
MKSNNSRLTNLILVVAASITIFGIGYKAGEYKTRGSFTAPSTSTDLRKLDFNLFWETLDEVESKFIDRNKIDSKKLYYGAIKGMVSSLEDPYTFFLTPEENKQSKDDLEGKFEGIGAQLGLSNGRIVIIAPLKGSPAEKAGARAGDFINKVDGKSTSNWTLTEAVSKIRGEKGSTVKMLLERKQKEFELAIVRDQIIVESVETDYFKNIVRIKVNQFGENTNIEWDKAVSEVENKFRNGQVKGLILDVRDNPGGYLESSVYLASEFLKKGDLVVKQESTVSPSKNYYAQRTGRLVDLPVVVLINKGSASASEILAGALRDNKKAKLIGEKSFGKGSVQEAMDLSDNAGLHVTVAKWILPNGDWINGKGIEPAIKVENKIDEKNTITNETDAQLQRAIGEFGK